MSPGAKAGHERKDADVLGLTMIALFLLLIIAICFLCVSGLIRLFNHAQAAQRSARAQVTDRSEEFPAPRLETNPELDLKNSRASAAAKLNSYGWIDRNAGIVRIPIARAMQITLERGLPEVGGGQTRLQLMQARPAATPRPNESNTLSSPGATP